MASIYMGDQQIYYHWMSSRDQIMHRHEMDHHFKYNTFLREPIFSIAFVIFY